MLGGCVGDWGQATPCDGQDPGTDLGPGLRRSARARRHGTEMGRHMYPSPWCPGWDWHCPSVAPLPATLESRIPKHREASRAAAQGFAARIRRRVLSKVSGGETGRTWDRGRGLGKSLPDNRGVMEEVEHTCQMEGAGGERWDGVRVREAVHLGYLPERAKAVTKGTSNGLE